MGNMRSTLTADRRYAMEQKLGIGLLGGLLVVFFVVLSARVGGFGWSEKAVEVNVGEAVASADGTGSYSSSPDSTAASSREPYAPPQVYLPPAPPPVVADYPLPTQPAVAKPAVAANFVPPPTSNNHAPPLVDGHNVPAVTAAPVTVAVAPPATVQTSAVVPATPNVREPGVAAIGLVTGTQPVSPIRSSPPAVLPSAIPPMTTQLKTPHSPPSTPAAVHVFAEGDNFWTIAKKAYGDGAYYRALFTFNQDRYPHPEDLRPGDRIDLPPLADLRSKFPQLCP